MDLLRIFCWYLKEKDVFCEFKKLYNDYSLKRAQKVYDHKKKCYKTVTAVPFYISFNRLITNAYSNEELKDIFYILLPYNWVNTASRKLLNAEKRWHYFLKNNVFILNNIKEGDTLSVSKSKSRFFSYPSIRKDSLVEKIEPNGMVKVKAGLFNPSLPLTQFDIINGEKIEYYIKRRNKIYKGNAK